ncbi:MAG: serine hydrolase [Deltaproteobacteria bacterium]|nr:serine hydrolase [Deltaproteobacteria bacterium]
MKSYATYYEDNPTYQANTLSAWKTAHPSKHHMDADRLLAAQKVLAQNNHSASFLVVRNHHLIWESYFNGAKPNSSMNVHSISKSIMAALVGIALERGQIASLNQPVADILGHQFKIQDEKRKISIRHLLTMTSGLDWKEDVTEYEIERTSNWLQAIFSLPGTSRPGVRFNYSTGDTHILSAVLTHATGQSLCAFAHEVLFDPLNIRAAHWGRDKQGYSSGGCNLYLTPREIATVAALFLQNGKWNNRLIVSPSWMQQMWTPQAKVDSKYDYGYLWWILSLGGYPTYKMWGWGGQFVYIMPSLDLMIVMTSSTATEHRDLDGDDFVETYILPALTVKE